MPFRGHRATLTEEAHTSKRTLVRIAVAAPLVGWAVLIAYRAWNPLYHGCTGKCLDSGGPVCLSMAAVMLSVAVLLATAAIVIAWPSARCWGFLAVACLAVVASLLPALFFKWSSRPDGWPWVWIAEDFDLSWLRFDQAPPSWFWPELSSAHWVGVTIQLLLAVIAIASLAAHVAYRLAHRAAPLPAH